MCKYDGEFSSQDYFRHNVINNLDISIVLLQLNDKLCVHVPALYYIQVG